MIGSCFGYGVLGKFAGMVEDEKEQEEKEQERQRNAQEGRRDEGAAAADTQMDRDGPGVGETAGDAQAHCEGHVEGLAEQRRDGNGEGVPRRTCCLRPPPQDTLVLSDSQSVQEDSFVPMDAATEGGGVPYEVPPAWNAVLHAWKDPSLGVGGECWKCCR